jgi:DTW domain-containing protein
MGQRTKSKDRCPRCYIRRVLCLCPIIPRFELDTKLIILIHNRETKRPTNTGRIACLALLNSEIRIRGLKNQPTESSGLIESGRTTLLLYPDENAVDLTPHLVNSLGEPINLVVPDGSWRQAAKVTFREPSLKGALRVKLPPGPPTEYRLRRESKENGLATFEAIARALGVIEGLHVQTELETFFRILVERTLWSRGMITAKEVKSGLPKEARPA